MLTFLAIENVVLIDRLTVAFEPGFSALTGETGAGKSILLDALGLALGGRSDFGLVRKGQEQAVVSAEFHVNKDHSVHALLAEQGLSSDDTLILRRVVGTDGRSRAFINDQPVSAGLLRQAGALLVEIHGQFDTQGLLDMRTHRGLLDQYAGIDGAALAKAWDSWRGEEKELAAAQERAARARAEEDYLRGAVEDLDELAPEAGEEQKLAGLRDTLKRRDHVLQALAAAGDGLAAAEDTLNQVWRALDKAGDGIKPLRDTLDRVQAELQDAAAQVESQSAALHDSEYSLAEIDDRLFGLRGQARKHGCTPDDLPRVRDELAAQLSLIERQEEIMDGLKDKAAKARQDFVKKAAAASAARAAAAGKLDGLVAKELPPLKLDKARFVTNVDKLPEEEWGPAGTDRVRFLVATNPGSAPGPLDKIASGGEMARFMLALKVVMTAVGGAHTLIFDEVDTGIGGSTAAAVGDRLARLAKNRQILVVTHAPQVAARASHHWIVAKAGKADVRTTVVPLAEAASRQEEIARMLSGAEITDEARAAANRLLATGS